MQLEFHRWGPHQLLLTYEEAITGGADEQARSLFARLQGLLAGHGLGLADVVRTRLWARSRRARDSASRVRRETLSGAARSASSSYIAPGRFAGSGVVALDAVTLCSREPGARKHPVEHDPPRIPVRYLTMGGLVVLSGVTTGLPTLSAQVAADVDRIAEMLVEAGSSWSEVAAVRCYLHSGHSHEKLLSLLDQLIPVRLSSVSVEPVDGFSAPGKLVEIEVTATRLGPAG